MALALKEATRLSYLLWLPAVAVLLLVLMWKAPFQLLEDGSATIGLTMLVFVVAMVALRPPWGDVRTQIVHPRMDTVDSLSQYLFVGISLFGGYMTPFQFIFYSAGAVEEEWDGKDLLINRVTSFLGSGFGGVISFAIIVTSGMVLFPQQAQVSGLQEIVEPVQRALGDIGWAFLLLGVFGVCLGAGLEAALSGAYAACQFFGWDWGKRARPREAPLFTLIYVAMVLAAVAIALTGVNPIKITVVVMAFAAASLPFTFLPLLLVANDDEYMGDQKNTWPVNAAAIVILVLLVLVTILTLPLLIITGGGV